VNRVRRNRTSLASRLTVDQCVTALEQIRKDAEREAAGESDPITTLARIARRWSEADPLLRGIRPVMASGQIIYIDRENKETIIYWRDTATYHLGRPTDAVQDWARL
jgi:hypothetical protein